MAQVACKTISYTGSCLSFACMFLIYMFVSLFTVLYRFVRKGCGALGCQHVGSLEPRQLNCRSLFPTFSNLVVLYNSPLFSPELAFHSVCTHSVFKTNHIHFALPRWLLMLTLCHLLGKMDVHWIHKPAKRTKQPNKHKTIQTRKKTKKQANTKTNKQTSKQTNK